MTGLDFAVATFEPGWRWSDHVGPCRHGQLPGPHNGYVLQGRMRFRMDDGAEGEFGPGDVFMCPRATTRGSSATNRSWCTTSRAPWRRSTRRRTRCNTGDFGVSVVGVWCAKAGTGEVVAGERLSDRIALGVLTRAFPPELVDEVVAECGPGASSATGCCPHGWWSISCWRCACSPGRAMRRSARLLTAGPASGRGAGEGRGRCRRRGDRAGPVCGWGRSR